MQAINLIIQMEIEPKEDLIQVQFSGSDPCLRGLADSCFTASVNEIGVLNKLPT